MIKYVKLVEVYPAGITTKTFTHEIINDDSVIEVYTEDANIYPTATTQSGNTVTISIVDHDEPVEVCVTINNMVSYSEPITSSDVFDPIFGSVSSALLHYEEVKQNNLIAGSGITIGGITGSEISADVTAGDLATVSEQITGLTKIVDDAIDGGYIQNKNLWDGTVNKGLWIVNNVITSNASGQYTIVKCKGGKTYTVSKKNLGLLWIASTSAYPSANVPVLDVQQGGSSNTKVATITTSANANYLIIEFGAGGTIEPSTYEELMIEESASATSYVERVPSNTELKQSLSQLSEVTSGNATVASDKMTNPSLRWYKVGNVAHIFGYFTISATWNGAQESAFNNLPLPQEDVFVFANKYGDGTTRRMRLIKNGNDGSLVQLYSNMPADQYFINLTYICK